jgi:hypothetical protein
MNYLHKFFLLSMVKDAPKIEFYTVAGAVDFFTWFKNDATEGTMLCLSIKAEHGGINQIVDCLPENCNQIAFDGLFFKCTAHRCEEGSGNMKKYSAWINPGNIACIHSMQPDSTTIFFRGGQTILIANRLPEVMKNLFEHDKKYRERKKQTYGGNKG